MLKIKFTFGVIIFLLSFLFFEASSAEASVDLVLSDIKVSPTEPAISQETVITIEIKATCDEDITDGAWVDSYNYTIEDFDKTAFIKPVVDSAHPLKDGGTVAYVFKGRFNKIGEKSIIFRINDDEVIEEVKMGNNNMKKEIIVKKAFNITPIEISVYPANPYPTQESVITVKVKNNGIVEMTQDMGFDFDFQDFRKGGIVHDYITDYKPLPVGETTIYEIHGEFLSTGEKAMTINFDVDKKIDESNEEDNSISFTPTIVPAENIDLKVESLEIDADNLILKEDIKIVAEVKNVGQVSIQDKEGFAIEDDNYLFPDFKMTKIEQPSFPSKSDLFEPGESLYYIFYGRFEKDGDKNISFTFNAKQDLGELDFENNYLEEDIYVYASMDEVNDFEIVDYNLYYYDADTVFVSWETSKESNGVVYLRMFNVSTPPQTIAASRNELKYSVTINDLEEGKSYFYQIEASRGDNVIKTQNVEFRKLQSDDVELLSSPEAQITGSSSKVSWETNMLSNSCLYYRLAEANDFTKKCLDESVVLHSVGLENIAAGDYEYYVFSKAANGEEIASEEYEFKIAAASVVENTIPEEEDTAADQDPENQTNEQYQNQVVQSSEIKNQNMYQRLKGKILIKVEDAGRAYYVNPQKQSRHYLGRPDDAFGVMREQGVGISNANLDKIQVAAAKSAGEDSDGDGLSDMLEDAIGSDKNSKDSDGDGYGDFEELNSGYNANGQGKMNIDSSFAAKHVGKIFLQIEGMGEAWYINPLDNKRYFLGRPADAFAIMRELGLGISNNDFDAL